MLSQITCEDWLIQLVGKTFEVVAYQPHWIHDGRKGWEDFARLDQRRLYSIAQHVDLNWGDGNVQSAGWGGGTGWGTGGGWPDEAENLLGGDDD